MTRTAALAAAEETFDSGRFRDQLAHWVTYRTESQVPESAPYMAAYLTEAIRPSFEAMGFASTLIPNPTGKHGPFLVATREEDPALPTVLSYGHCDVIRGLEGQWRQGLDPWVLKVEGEKWFGRGTADNKSQHLINILALSTVLKTRGRLGFNCKFLLETGEEVGSPGLHEFVEQEKTALAADLLIASDGPRLEPDRPTIFLGARGALTFNLTVNLREGGHHSGNWGGLLANPGIILSHAIASLIDRDGRVKLRDLLPAAIPNSVRHALADCPITEPPEGPSIDAWWGEPGLTAAEKVVAWNTFEILAFKTGNPERPVNAIPPVAVATCQIRFTVDVPPETFLPAIRRHLDANGFGNVEVAQSTHEIFPATRLDPDHPAARWAAASIERTTGRRPAILPNLGGSLPNECFAGTLGLPTVWVPHSYTGCSQHAPNEHVLAPLLREGLRMMTGLFWDLGETPPLLSSARG